MSNRYRKKAVEVEAVQWTGENQEEVQEFTGGMGNYVSPSGRQISLGYQFADVGDYIVRDSDGAIDPYSPETFAVTYEPAVPSSTPVDGDGLREALEAEFAEVCDCEPAEQDADGSQHGLTKCEFCRLRDRIFAATPVVEEAPERVTVDVEALREALRSLEPPSYAERDFGAGTSLNAAYRAGFYDAKQDATAALADLQESDSGGEGQ